MLGCFQTEDMDDPSDGKAAMESFLSSAYAAAATRSASIVTQTVDMDDDAPPPFVTSVDLDGPSTNTIIIGASSSGEAAGTYPTDEASSLAPTTFATATSTLLDNNNQNQDLPDPTAPAESSATLLPIAQNGHDGGLSRGQVAAAIAVPILFTALLAVLAFLILRRRKNSRHRNANDGNSSIRGGANGGFFGLREKWGSLKSSASSHKEPQVTSLQNRAYMSGLDTSSRGTSSQQNSGEYYNDPPPPPYKVNVTTHAQAAPVLPMLSTNLSKFDSRPCTPQPMTQRNPPHPPISPLSDTHSAFLTPWTVDYRPNSSSHSAQSINSDAYSDTASIHSARAARMSVGGPTIITTGPHLPVSRAESLGDPFDDPHTPVPSLPGDALLQLEPTSEEARK